MDMPQILSPSSSGRRTRTSNASNSPEFEFWMVRNPSFPEPNLHSADELFSDGVLLPLHSLPHQSNDPPDSLPEPPITDLAPGSGPDTVAEVAEPAPPLEESLITTLTASKRWKDIFKKNTHESKNQEDKEKEKKKERKSGGTGGGANGGSAAELNIYLWPFSRSRSAGTGGSRARMATAGSTRKVSSAPCSRSNSAGESKSRKWPSSPSRAGVHLGRSSPVWQVRRSGSGRNTADPLVRNAEKGMKKEGNDTRRCKPAATVLGGGGDVGTKAKVLKLNVPTCIGYRHHMGCRSDENSATNIATARGGNVAVGRRSAGIGAGESGRGSNLFNLRNLFSKKVY